MLADLPFVVLAFIVIWPSLVRKISTVFNDNSCHPFGDNTHLDVVSVVYMILELITVNYWLRSPTSFGNRPAIVPSNTSW